MLRARAASLLALLVLAVISFAVLRNLRVTTSMTYFLPNPADQRAAGLLRGIAEGETARTIVCDVSGDAPDRLQETATKMMAALRTAPGIASVRSGIDETTDGAKLAELFTTKSPTALLDPEDFDDERLTARLQKLRIRLASPLGPVVRQLAPRDPLGGTMDALEEAAGGALTSNGGVLFTTDQKHAFVFVVTKDSAWDAPAQQIHLARIQSEFERARGSANERLETSAVARHSVAAEGQIKADIERVGLISTIGILALFVLLFGSLRMVALGLVALGVGTALALVVTQLAFGEIHGLTLAFGTSLLGVGIDYAEHYFTHYSLKPERGPYGVMTSVWPGLWMGAVSTVIGFVGFGATDFPGVRQMAVFSTVAIAGGLAATRFLLPPWMPAPYKRPRLMVAAERVATSIMNAATKRRWLVFVPAALAIAFLPMLARARFADDLASLIELDPQIVAEDTRVRSRLGPADPGRFVVVVRENEEDALVALEKTVRALEGAKRDGLVERALSLAPILRSRARQEASFARAKQRRGAIEEALRREGFVPEAFAPFFAELDKDQPSLLRLEDLRASPLGPTIEPLAPRLPEGQAFVLPVSGVTDLQRLGERLPDAVVLDEHALASSAYRDVRKSILLVLPVGLVMVFITLFARYRSPRTVLAAMVPALLGAAGALAALAAFGVMLNLLHLVALLLVLSMGVDFGIFIVEGSTETDSDHRGSSLLSVVTATSTTLLSFGLLAWSPAPALRALGSTITVGLVLSMALCPLSQVFIKRARPQ